MQRITHPSAVAVEPVLVEAGITGYFDDQTPGAETVLTARWLNRLQEEVCNVITGNGGLTLDGTSDTQLSTALGFGIGRTTDSISALINTPCDKGVFVSQHCGIVAAASYVGCLASVDCDLATVIYSATVAADDCDMSATVQRSAVMASRDCLLDNTGTTDCSAIVACDGVWIGNSADGQMCAAVGCQDVTVDGTNNVAIASTCLIPSKVAGTQSVVIASKDCLTTSGEMYQMVLGSEGCTASADSAIVIGSAGSFTSGNASTIMASRCAELHHTFSVGGGYDGGAAITETDADQNLSWRIDSDGGNVTIDGNFVDTGIDYAEFFENAEEGVIEVGSLVSRVGRKIRAAVPGDRILGVVSAQPAMCGGGAGLHWEGKYERDLFGGYVLELDAQGRMSRKVSDDFDPRQPYIDRASRPDEWTCVGLLGQLRVRIDDTVTSETSYIEPGPDGIGTATDDVTRCEVMDIETPYSAERGYGVALCLVR